MTQMQGEAAKIIAQLVVLERQKQRIQDAIDAVYVDARLLNFRTAKLRLQVKRALTTGEPPHDPNPR
jgi:uncharacterized protein (UPF0335 family)